MSIRIEGRIEDPAGLSDVLAHISDNELPADVVTEFGAGGFCVRVSDEFALRAWSREWDQVPQLGAVAWTNMLPRWSQWLPGLELRGPGGRVTLVHVHLLRTASSSEAGGARRLHAVPSGSAS